MFTFVDLKFVFHPEKLILVVGSIPCEVCYLLVCLLKPILTPINKYIDHVGVLGIHRV